MKLFNSQIEVFYGEEDVKAKAEPHTESDELHDSEDPTEDQKNHVESVLGLDLNELFKDE